MIYPRLRFKNTNGDPYPPLKEKRLDQISDIERGKFSARPRNDPKYFNGTMPFVQTGDVVRSNLYLEKYTQTLNPEGIKVSKVFQKNTVLITIAANIGDTAITKFELACPDSLVAITPKEGVSESIWIKFALDTKRNELESQATQNAQKNINLQVLNPLILMTPSFDEQTKIATFLSAIDEKVYHLTQKHELLEQYKKGVMQKIFSQDVRFKDDQGKEFPEWDDLYSNEIFRNVTNKEHNGDLQILAATQDRGMIPRTETGLDIKSSDKSVNSYKIVDSGDFVISLRSFQGGIEYSENRGICSPVYTILKSKLPIADGFYKAFFKTEDFIERLSATVIGIRDGKQISYSAFSTLRLPHPSLKEQIRISSFLASIDERITNTKSQLEAIKQYKQGLLQQMFV